MLNVDCARHSGALNHSLSAVIGCHINASETHVRVCFINIINNNKLRVMQLFPGLEDVYEKHRDALCSYIGTRFRMDFAEAEDIVQTAFTKIFSRECGSELENPKAFLYRVACNLAIDDRRHKRVEDVYCEHSLAHTDEAQETTNPERILEGRQRVDIISRAMWHMPSKRRQLLLMNRFDHLSFAEIGRRVSLSEGAVRKHVAKALRDCTRALEKHEHNGVSVSEGMV